ncbi:rhodanese-like domain-containing protein [Altererythrobacter sp.]|nr:rhodanese-like domain-containing protein [Altererythrobacter sp.]
MAIAGIASWWNSRDLLADVHAGVESSFPDVAHILSGAFSQLDTGSLLIFDTREEDEFAVSHLPGALRIDPDLAVEDFLAKYGDQVMGKTVVFYCSVGVRSSEFADKVQSALKADGAAKVVNLKHGLFGWLNDGRQLVSSDGKATQAIHPYDGFWGWPTFPHRQWPPARALVVERVPPPEFQTLSGWPIAAGHK